MTSLELLYKLFEVSSEQLGVEYIKTTPTRLESWASKHNKPFIALLAVEESTQTNDLNNNIITFDCTFVLSLFGEKDPTDEKKVALEVHADKLVKRFQWFIKRNTQTKLENASSTEYFRSSSFNGVGRGFVLSLSMADLVDYCEDYCNDSTKRIDCDD